jgi:hypothetical protein
MQQRRNITPHLFFFLLDEPSRVSLLMTTPFILFLNNSIHVKQYALTEKKEAKYYYAKACIKIILSTIQAKDDFINYASSVVERNE